MIPKKILDIPSLNLKIEMEDFDIFKAKIFIWYIKQHIWNEVERLLQYFSEEYLFSYVIKGDTRKYMSISKRANLIHIKVHYKDWYEFDYDIDEFGKILNDIIIRNEWNYGISFSCVKSILEKEP